MSFLNQKLPSPGELFATVRQAVVDQVTGGMPTKRTINLATVGEKRINWVLTIPGILLVLLLVAIFCNFAVVRRYDVLDRERWALNTLTMELMQARREEAELAYVEERYAHYTFSGMTEEEMARASRVDLMGMLWRQIMDKYDMDSWSVSGNRVTVSVYAKTLQEINLLAESLMHEEMVDYCTVTNAATYDQYASSAVEAEEEGEGQERVHANLILYLIDAPQEVSFH